MTDVTNLYPSVEERIEQMKGPARASHAVIVEGRIIPRLTMRENEDTVSLILDNRFTIDVPKEFATQIAWFAANALAIGSGYSFLGSPNKDQPFAPVAVAFSNTPKTERE